MSGLIESIIKSVKQENPTSGREDRLFKQSQHAFQISEDYFQLLKPDMIDRYKLYNSKHCSDEAYNEDEKVRSKHFVPKSHEFVKNSVAQFVQAYFMNPDYLYLTPESSEDIVAVMSAEYFSYVLNKRLKKNGEWLNFIQMTSQSGLINNMCIAKVDWDADDKRSVATPIMMENLRVDPHADPLDPLGSSSFIIYRMEMYVDQIKEKKESAGWLDFSTEDLQSNFVSSMSVTDDVEESRNPNGFNPQKGHSAIDPALQKVYVHENIIRDGNKYAVFYTLGTTKMLSKVLDLKDIYKQGIPFVMAPLFPEEMKIYSTAPLDHAKEAQKLINRFTNITMDGIEMSVFPRLGVKSGSGVDIKRLQKTGPGSVWESRNPSTDVVQFNAQVQLQSLKNELPFLMNNFDSTVGGTSNSTLSSEGGDNTATSQNMRGRLGSQVINMYLMNYNERFIELVLLKRLACEKAYGLGDDKAVEQVFRSLNLLNRYRNKLAAVGINADDFEVDKAFADAEINLSVNVGMGAASPQLRIEQFLASITALKNLVPNIEQQLDTKEVIKELMSLNGYKDYTRFFTSEEDPRLADLQSQVQQLQTALQAKKSPEEIAADIQLKQASAQDKMKKIGVSDKQMEKLDAEIVGIKVANQLLALEGAEKLAIMPEIAAAGDKLMENAGAVDPTPQDGMF